MRRKKVLLLVVDACTPRVVDAGIAAGRLPNLARLREGAFYDGESSAIFPSITPAATASIVTGVYPVEHGVVGAHWYDSESGEVAYYGDDLTVIREKGAARYIEDLLVRLNAVRLQGETLFDRVERAGLRSACINHIIFRGPVQHEVRLPFLARLLPGLTRKASTVPGPTGLYLGDLVESRLFTSRRKPSHATGVWHRLGLDDRSTADVLLELVKSGLPELTVAYFPDYDFHAHQAGSMEGMPEMEQFDAILGELFEAAGGLEALLRDCCVMLTSDHSMSDIKGGDKAELSLDQALAGFSIAAAGKGWDKDDADAIVCVNMRAAQVYFREPTPDAVDLAVEQLLAHRRVDQVLWRTGPADSPRYHVATRERGRLIFCPTREHEAGTLLDEWGQPWAVEGDLETVAGDYDDGVLRSSLYPNPFERIRGALDAAVGGHLWVTAVPGVELTVKETEAHENGGAHGSLHAVDSLVPLLAAGLPEDLRIKAPTRTVDVTPLCLEVLGVEPPRPRGASHVTAMKAR